MGWWRRLRGGAKRGRTPVPVILFTRAGCHLCDIAAEMLRAASEEFPLVVETIDIDADTQLILQYGDKVPVLRIAGRDRLFGCINPVLLRRTLRADLADVRDLRIVRERPSQA